MFSFPIFRIIFLCTFISFLSSCAYLESYVKDDTQAAKPVPLTEREKLFLEAEKNYKSGDLDHALPLYLRIARDPSEPGDLVYEKSVLKLAEIYEKTDQSEKAILAFDELLKTESQVLTSTALRIGLIKNHYRVSNYYQAKLIKNEIDNDYRSQRISSSEIFQALYYQTDLYYDRHIADELLFLGEIQKYFVYVIESDIQSESDKATDLLMLYYKKFVSFTSNSVLSTELKKALAVSLIDQLSQFDKFRMQGSESNLTNFNRFAKFASLTQKNLSERLANGKF